MKLSCEKKQQQMFKKFSFAKPLLESLGVYLIRFLSSIHSLYLYEGVGKGVSLLDFFDLEMKILQSRLFEYTQKPRPLNLITICMLQCLLLWANLSGSWCKKGYIAKIGVLTKFKSNTKRAQVTTKHVCGHTTIFLQICPVTDLAKSLMYSSLRNG